jgi:hypothetical protein
LRFPNDALQQAGFWYDIRYCLRMYKQFVGLCILCTISFHGKCQFFSGLDLCMYDNSPFSISMDNMPFTSPSNRIILNNLLPGAHFIKITANPSGKWPKGYGNAFFTGIISIPYNARILAFIDEYRGFQVSDIISSIPFPETNTGFYQRTFVQDADFYKYPKYNLTDSTAFFLLKEKLKESNTSSERLIILKRSLIPNKVSTTEIRELIRFLDFDKERLEFATYAYYFTSDREDYYLLKDSFIFPGTVKELYQKTYHLY